MRSNRFKLLFLISCAIALAGCDIPESSDHVQARQQESISAQGNAIVGMPAITNFREKRLLKMVYELRDQEIATITYTQDLNGNLHKLCDSVGYGIPYATQFTNPQRLVADGHGVAAIAQADPNGLFSPASAEGTWVMCANPKTSKLSPVYAEIRVIVSPFELK